MHEGEGKRKILYLARFPDPEVRVCSLDLDAVRKDKYYSVYTLASKNIWRRRFCRLDGGESVADVDSPKRKCQTVLCSAPGHHVLVDMTSCELKKCLAGWRR